MMCSVTGLPSVRYLNLGKFLKAEYGDRKMGAFELRSHVHVRINSNSSNIRLTFIYLTT